MPKLQKVSTILLLPLLPVCALAWGSSGTLQERGGNRLTLREAARIALEKSPRLASVRQGAEAAEAGLREAESERLPRLSFKEAYTHSNNPVFVFGSLLEQARFGPGNFSTDSLNSPGSLSRFRSSLELQIPVFNRLGVASRIEKAHIDRRKAETSAEFLQQQVRYRVIETYLGVLVAGERKRVADEAVRTAQAELQQIQDLERQGMVVTSDALAMEVQLAEFQQEMIEAEGRVRVAYAALSATLGVPVGADQDLEGPLTGRTFDLPDQAALLGTALQFRPDYQGARLEVEARDQDVRAARGRAWPDLNLFADYGASSRGLTDGSSDFAVGARVTLDLLDFGRTPRTDRARAFKRAAEADRRTREDEIRLEVAEAYESVQAALKKRLVAETSVRHAFEIVRIIQDRYEAGLTTITELLRSQTALVRAQLSLLISRYDYLVGYARTRLATGTLTEVTDFGP